MTTDALPLAGRLLVPLANEEDAERTCEAVLAHVERDGRPEITLVHVIEKAGGAPDKAPMEARERQAEDVFRLAESSLGDAGYDVDTELLYATDVAEALVDAAEETGATALVFVPRDTGRLTRLLTGDLSKRLVLESPVPVVSLPPPDSDSD